jgi:hypothetical protein
MRDDAVVRTTLDIEDDVLLAVKQLARQRGQPAGRLVSEIVRKSLTNISQGAERSGVPLFPVRPESGIVTMELVNRLREENT